MRLVCEIVHSSRHSIKEESLSPFPSAMSVCGRHELFCFWHCNGCEK